MATNSARATDQIVEFHEDRILRMESELPDLVRDVATVAVQQRGLGEKMEELKTVMIDHATASANGFAMIGSRVKVLETEKVQSDWTKALAKRLATPLAIVATVLVTQYAEALYKWFVS